MGGEQSGISNQQMNEMLEKQRREILQAFDKVNQQHQNTIKNLVEAMKKEQEKTEKPEDFHAIQIKYEDKFVQSIKTLKFSEVIKSKEGRHYCFIGPTSVGKSSLLNALFGLQLKVGLGSTTKEASRIKTIGNVTYWDAPGINKDFGFYKPHHLGFFNDLDKIFVLFDSEIGQIALILKVFNAMNKELVLIRTKCDNWKPQHAKTIKEELQTDLNQARQYYPACKEVIGVGLGNYEHLRPALS